MHSRAKGSIYIHKCNSLSRLPSELWLKESLHIRECHNFSSLPEDLRVGGTLSLIDLPKLTSLPERLIVNESLVLLDVPLEQFPHSGYIGYHVYISPDMPRAVTDTLHQWKQRDMIKGEIKTVTKEVYLSLST